MGSKISIIIPVYKVEKYIHRCIDSVLGQTYSNIEVILVDDGSPDLCGRICDEYAKKDNRVVVIHKENAGLSGARNSGLNVATGDYIGFVDSDDYISRDMYGRLMYSVESSGKDIGICNFARVFSDHEETAFEFEEERMFSQDEMYEAISREVNWQWITVWNKLYRKEIFENLRFPEGRIHEDEAVIHNIIFMSNGAAFIPDEMYYYVQRQGSIMSMKSNKRMSDAYDAYMERTEFFIKNNMPFYAAMALKKTVNENGYNELGDKKNIELRKRYRFLYRKILLRGMPKKMLGPLSLFYISPKIYAIGISLNEKLKKAEKHE